MTEEQKAALIRRLEYLKQDMALAKAEVGLLNTRIESFEKTIETIVDLLKQAN